MKLNKLLIPLAAFVLPTACSYNPDDYSCFTDIDPYQGWKSGETLVYLPSIADSIARGSLSLLVRHTNDYAFSNLWIEVQTQRPQPDGTVALDCDTFNIELADIYGNWHGTGRGSSFQKTETLFAEYDLANGAPIRLRHLMRPDRLSDIEQVGLIFNANTQQ